MLLIILIIIGLFLYTHDHPSEDTPWLLGSFLHLISFFLKQENISIPLFPDHTDKANKPDVTSEAHDTTVSAGLQ